MEERENRKTRKAAIKTNNEYNKLVREQSKLKAVLDKTIDPKEQAIIQAKIKKIEAKLSGMQQYNGNP